MKKVKWIERFQARDAGFVAEVTDERAEFLIASGKVVEVKEKKKQAKPPADKMVRGSMTK